MSLFGFIFKKEIEELLKKEKKDTKDMISNIEESLKENINELSLDYIDELFLDKSHTTIDRHRNIFSSRTEFIATVKGRIVENMNKTISLKVASKVKEIMAKEFNDEDFIDSVIKRINDKQLK